VSARRRSTPPAALLVLGAVVSVQSGGAVATKLFDDVGPGGAVFLRLALSGLLLGILVRPAVRSRPAAHLRAAAVFGLVLAAMNSFFYEALARTPLGIAVTVEFVGPLLVAVLGSRRRLDLAWAGLAAVGVALLADRGGGRVTAAGVAFALAAGGCWAAYILIGRRIGRIYAAADGLTLALVVGGIAVAPFGVAAGGRDLLRPEAIGLGLGVAVLSSAIPYSLELAALRRLPAAVFGVLMSIEPAAASVVGFVALGQALHPTEIVAVGLVSIASLGVTVLTPRRPQPEALSAT